MKVFVVIGYKSSIRFLRRIVSASVLYCSCLQYTQLQSIISNVVLITRPHRHWAGFLLPPKMRSTIDRHMNGSTAADDAWIETATNLINFSAHAAGRFKDGGLPIKRQLLKTLGESLTLKGKMLIIEASAWLVPVAELRNSCLLTGTTKSTPYNRGADADYESNNQLWCAREDLNLHALRH